MLPTYLVILRPLSLIIQFNLKMPNLGSKIRGLVTDVSNEIQQRLNNLGLAVKGRGNKPVHKALDGQQSPSDRFDPKVALHRLNTFNPVADGSLCAVGSRCFDFDSKAVQDVGGRQFWLFLRAHALPLTTPVS